MKPKEYFHKFATTALHNTAYNGNDYDEPWVALTVETDDVTYNKPSYLFDPALKKLERYDQSNLIVINHYREEDHPGDGETLGYKEYFYDTQIMVYEERQSVTSMLDKHEYFYPNAIVAYTEESRFIDSSGRIKVPSDSNIILVTNSQLAGDISSDFGRGNSYSQPTRDDETWYIYDYENMVVHTVFSDSGNSKDPVFPTADLVHVNVTQRDIDIKKVYEPMTVDTIQHASQLTRNTWQMDGWSNYYDFIENGETSNLSSNGVRLYATQWSDYVTVDDVVSDNRIRTAYLTTEKLLTENVTNIYVPLIEKNTTVADDGGSYTFRLYVDNELIDEKTGSFGNVGGYYNRFEGLAASWENGQWSLYVNSVGL